MEVSEWGNGISGILAPGAGGGGGGGIGLSMGMGSRGVFTGAGGGGGKKGSCGMSPPNGRGMAPTGESTGA